jgi:hypothetical protein
VNAVEDSDGDGAGTAGGDAGEFAPGQEFAHRRGPWASVRKLTSGVVG